MAAMFAPLGKHFWMSETSGYHSTWSDTGAFGLAKSIYLALKFGHINAWVWWTLSENPGSGDDVYTLMYNKLPTSRYYASKQYYRYIRPGAIMVNVSSTDSTILPLAFWNGAQAMLTYVFINNSSKLKTATITQTHLPSNVSVYRSSKTENCVAVNAYNAGVITLPDSSITTVVFQGTNNSPTINQPDDTVLLASNGKATIKLKGISDGDNDHDAQTVILTSSSSNTAIVPTPALTKLTDSTYNLTFTPASDTGTVNVTVNLQDNGSTDLSEQQFYHFQSKNNSIYK